MTVSQLEIVQTCSCGHSTEAHENSVWGDCSACDTCRKPRSSGRLWMRVLQTALRRGHDAGEVAEPCEHSLRPCYDCSSQRAGW